MNILFLFLAGYLIGSIPFGYIYTKHFCGIDLRDFGSNSTGTTNVLRTGNKKLAIYTLLSDALKGTVIVLLTSIFSGNSLIPLAIGFCCILGHVYPIWLKFKGGKGAATAAGTFLALSPISAIASAIIWIISAKLTKISSLASLLFCFSFTGITIFRFIAGNTSIPLVVYSIAVFAFLIYTHKDNLKRLIKKQEKTL